MSWLPSGVPHLAYPEFALLAIPALVLWWRWARRGHGRWWRLGVLLLAVAAATRPELVIGAGGSDVVVVLDRSDSMGAEERAAQAELLRLIGEQRSHRDDRLGVIAVGDGAAVWQAPLTSGRPALERSRPGTEASDLAAGLALAAQVVAAGRSARVVLHSDGEATGPDPRRRAAELAWRGIPVDVLPVRRAPAPDAAIVEVEVPGRLRLGESFIGALRLVSDGGGERGWRVLRGDRLVAEGRVAFRPGRDAVVSFADRPPRPGLAEYRVELDATDDRQPLNNRARAVVHVAGGERVLVMGGDGEPGNIARALEAAGMQVETVAEAPIDLDRLLGYRVLVLEQVPADRIGRQGLDAIARWVEDLGGGLVMTGGRRSFGSGGWHRSPVEDVLPVTMELRDEHRKLSLALAICLDRSGSMAAPVAGGKTKMDLANAGAAAAVELLSPLDEVAVFAVDSAPHVVVPMRALTDPDAVERRIRSIESMGGGIYVYQALAAGGRALAESGKGTRHLVLFADAADAEEPGRYRDLLADFRAAGITVSVIGLGRDTDVDARLLADIARLGGGRCTFAEEPKDLPRLFAQETVVVARSAWVDEAVRLVPDPGLDVVLGVQAEHWPTVPGYNLVYPRERAQVLVQAPGDPSGPGLALWHIGAGRSAAIPLDLDGPGSAGLPDWSGYAEFVGGTVRWCAGGSGDRLGRLAAERNGRHVRLELDLDPQSRAEWPTALPRITLAGGAGGARELDVIAAGDGRYRAEFRLDDSQAVLPAAVLGSGETARTILGPPQVLPYSPEGRPRHGLPPGTEALTGIARVSGGRLRGDVIGVYDNPPSPGRRRSLAPWLLIAALIAAVAEIAVRRLRLGGARRRATSARRGSGERTTGREPVAVAAEPSQPGVADPQPEPRAPRSAPEGEAGLHAALRELKRRRGE